MTTQLGGPQAALGAVKKSLTPRLSGFGMLKADDVLPKKQRKGRKLKAAQADDTALPKPKAQAPPPSSPKSVELALAPLDGAVAPGKPRKGLRKMGSFAKEVLTNIKNKVVKRRDDRA